MDVDLGVLVAMLAIFVVLAAVMIWRRGGSHGAHPTEKR